MKNYEQILADAGVELTDEQKATIAKEMGENYKTIADWQKQHDKVQTLETTLKDTQDKLKAFDGVDVANLNNEIAKLKGDLEQQGKDYQQQIADRDFSDMVKGLIAERKGVNEKAIMALLNIDELKESKNQKDDVIKALDALVEAEDSKMLFGSAEPEEIEKGNPIGSVSKNNGSGDAWLNQMMAAAGISAESEK